MEYVQNDSYDSYQSVSVSIISGVGPTSLQLVLFFHQTRHRTRMQAKDELSCMHRVGRRPSHRATSHHISLNITGLGIRTLLYFIIHNALQHSSSHAVAAIVGISHLPQGLKHIIQLRFVRLPPTGYGPTPPVESLNHLSASGDCGDSVESASSTCRIKDMQPVRLDHHHLLSQTWRTSAESSQYQV